MLQQEPLFKMQFEYICDLCHKSYKWKQKATVYVNNNWEKQICKKCVKDMLDNYLWVFHEWKIYDMTHDNVCNCHNCDKLMYQEDLINIPGNQRICIKCRREAWQTIRYCSSCGKFHFLVNWEVCNKELENDITKLKPKRYIEFIEHKETKSWWQKWEVKHSHNHTEEIRALPYQEERELSEYIKYDLNDFYDYEREDEDRNEFWINHYYYRQPIDIEWEILYKRYDWLNNFREKIVNIATMWQRDVEKWLKQNKYRNHFFKDISDDWLITRQYIDMMWNIKEKKESINKFFEDNDMDIDKVSLSKKVYYRLSSDLDHKCKSFRANDRFGSCQQEHNCRSYASWAYDAITNWCNCPILLYNNKEDMYVKACNQTQNKWRPIGRITSRIMYDKDGKMYILIDRLYQDGSLSSDVLKWNIYKSIILDLKRQWYNVIVTNYSAHDESTLQYIKALWINNTEQVRDLFQPLRRTFDIDWEYWECWYYSDWWIEVLAVEINNLWRTTDYLDKAYLIKD